MKFIITLILALINFYSFSQKKIERIKLNENYNSENYSQNELDEYYFNLISINNIKNKYYFRYRGAGKIVEIYSNDGIHFTGQLINEAKKYKYGTADFSKTPKPHQYIFEKIKLDSSASTTIGQFVLDRQFYKFPTDTLIKNWDDNYLKCEVINLSYKVNQDIYLANYSCLFRQSDTIEFVSKINNLEDTIFKVLKLPKLYSEFMSKLKKGKTYSKNGIHLMYISNKRQIKSWQKSQPKREYLKTISDTITSYLVKELNTLIDNKNEYNCCNEYQIFFTKKGEFKNIKVNISNFEKLNQKDYRKCLRMLKNTLKSVHINFVNPKYEFTRTIIFFNNKILVYNTTD